MSKQIDLKDAKEGMWVEFDSIEHDEPNGRVPEGHFAANLLDISKSTDMTFLSYLIQDHRTFGVLGSVVFPDTDDTVFALFWVCDGEVKPQEYVRNIRLYESKPEAATEDDGERITDITKVRPGDKVVVKSGNEYTVKKTDSDRVGGQTLCLSIGELGFPDGWWVDDSFFQYAYRGPYTMDDLPKEPGFYKARTESVWKHDGKRWMPVLSHDGTIAPAFPCQSQSRSQFFKTSVRDDRFPFTKVEASFE